MDGDEVCERHTDRRGDARKRPHGGVHLAGLDALPALVVHAGAARRFLLRDSSAGTEHTYARTDLKQELFDGRCQAAAGSCNSAGSNTVL